MRIPWIQELNERRRIRREERQQDRMARRLADGYESFRKEFAKSFGVPFELAVALAIQPRMKNLVRQALPDILNALAEGNPSVDNGKFGGVLVASLSGRKGAFWGEAPAGGEGPSTMAFHLSVKHDTENNRYLLSMIPGTAQVVGYNVSGLLELPSTVASFSDQHAMSCWFFIQWTRSSDTWQADKRIGSVNYGPPSPSNVDLFVPIFKFWIDDNKNAHVSQLVEGAVYLPWTVNALDVDSNS